MFFDDEDTAGTGDNANTMTDGAEHMPEGNDEAATETPSTEEHTM